MTSICINGGGFAGLSTALLLAADGHDVTVIERDPAPPSRDHEAVWESWERRAVPQFRQTHAYVARARLLLRSELPHVWTRLLEAGVREHNLATHPPLTITDRASRPGDEDLVYVEGRRPTVENVLRHCADDDPRIQVQNGAVGKGIIVAGDASTGLATSAGPIYADLVVDCGGRRSAMPDWIEEAGGVRPTEVAAEYRIAYWTQWFRLRAGGAMPELYGPPAVEIGPIEVLRIPADGGWFSITVVAPVEDRRFRVLADQARLLSFLRALDLTTAWVDPSVAETVDGVQPMFTVVDQRRRFVVEGRPCLDGLVAVGDSLAASNPSLARGTSFALMHAVALRDLLRDDRRVDTLAERYGAELENQFEPYWRSTIEIDQAHLERMRAASQGRSVAPDPGWVFGHAAMHDADLWRLAVRVRMALDLPEEVVLQPGVLDRVAATIDRVGLPQIQHLDVEGLLAG